MQTPQFALALHWYGASPRCSECWRKVDIVVGKPLTSLHWSQQAWRWKEQWQVLRDKRVFPGWCAGRQLLDTWHECGLEKAVRNPTKRLLIFRCTMLALCMQVRDRSMLQEHTVLHQPLTEVLCTHLEDKCLLSDSWQLSSQSFLHK